MTVDKKDLPKSQVELLITIPETEFVKYLDQAAVKLSKEMKVEGFRAGKVPRSIMERELGAAKIFEEAVRLAIPDTFIKAIEDGKIEAIGQPEIEPQKVASGNEFVYKARVAVLPKITAPDFSGVKVARRTVKVEDAEVDKVIKDLQNSRAKFLTVKRPAKKGDRVEVDFEAKLNKVTIEGGKSTNHPVIIGENKFVPGFEDKLLGLKADESKKFSLIFPKDYYQTKLANREVDFDVKLKLVQEQELPALDDAFAASIGKFKTLAELKHQVRHNLEHEKEHKEENRLEMAIVTELIKKTEMELPEVLVKSEQDKIVDEMEQSISQQGVPFDKYLESIKKTREELSNDQKDSAIKRVKASLILRAIAGKEKVTVAEKELDDEIKKLKDAYGKMYQDQPKLLEHFDTEDYRHYLRSMMLNRKVFGVLKKACVK